MRMRVRRMLPVLLVLAIGIGGCANWSPSQKLLAAEQTFTSTVNALATARSAGAFTPQEGENITMYIELGRQSLDEWQASIRLNQDSGPSAENFAAVMRTLTAKQIAAERAKKS